MGKPRFIHRVTLCRNDFYSLFFCEVWNDARPFIAPRSVWSDFCDDFFYLIISYFHVSTIAQGQVKRKIFFCFFYQLAWRFSAHVLTSFLSQPIRAASPITDVPLPLCSPSRMSPAHIGSPLWKPKVEGKHLTLRPLKVTMLRVRLRSSGFVFM